MKNLKKVLFVVVFNMGVTGAAWATILAQLISAIAVIFRLCGKRYNITVRPSTLRIHPDLAKSILLIGIPAGLQQLVTSAGSTVVQTFTNSFGSNVVAANSTIIKIDGFIILPMMAIGTAITTFVGQNYGAGKIDRCKKTFVLSLIEDAIASGTAIFIVLLFGHTLLSVFDSDTEVIRIGYIRLAVIFFAYIFSMLYEVMSGYMRGFGISLAPAILTTIGVCGVRIAWIKLVFPHSSTFETIMTAYPISLATTALLIFAALIVYRPSRRFAAQNKDIK